MAFQSPVIVQSSRAVFPKAVLWLPHVSGGPNEAAIKKINESIRQGAQQLVADQGSLEDPRSEMQGFYEVKTNEKDILSLSLYNYAYTGGAHGLTLQQPLTFKVSTGQSYVLSDLFKPGSDYVNRLSDIISEQIKERDISTIEPFDKIRPDQYFYIADRSLVIFFALYELTPYAYGFPYFPISVYDLLDIIDENGPLGIMAQNN
ncbi:DUF3298 and DUF4163 domain-containing protein [Paenibacillus sp. NEAU-GSW1]|uniref:DUF3298 and DUF4163 domain-containing protein n=1 Tax=Paenibacillus sp. NEAU-GSW1 TaxID=2682486 RepID=UPI0012E2C6BD|nr:DUF3298 and DUF4163 domain-containing protein [Paenibacillus sp. NEAU-GSW1]MUT67371.1 DUF3298 domain-containing protein [Paenibacillus sp. NEAU-GSW1]